MKTILASASALVLTLAMGCHHNQPAAVTTTHTETTATDMNGDQKHTDVDSTHVEKQDGTQINKTTTTSKEVTPPPSGN